jgi:hypothetical protein
MGGLGRGHEDAESKEERLEGTRDSIATTQDTWLYC